MTSSIKRVISDTLAAHLAARIPAFGGRVRGVHAGPETEATLPAAVVLPAGKMVYDPHQADQVYFPDEDAPDDGIAIMEVGAFTGTFEVRIYARTPPERERLEQQITDLFLATELAPGILKLDTPPVTVGGAVSLYQAPVAYRLENADWQEEFSFEAKRFSFLDVAVDFPALIARDAYTMQTVYLAITTDLDSDTPEETILVPENDTEDE